jgi:hypothetical protein
MGIIGYREALEKHLGSTVPNGDFSVLTLLVLYH